MALQEEILDKAAEIRTDSYQMSLGEIINLYRDGELDVHPEFQRIYRWSDSQKTKLIESILLGIPIPPIFVAQRKDGVWDVVDGVQRLSTILQFIGVLRDEDSAEVPPLTLQGTKYLPSLQGKVWNAPDGDNAGFTPAQQLYLKRAKIDVNIVLKESDDQSKYELFMRLNTGGSALTRQEVRNCLLVMANRSAFLWLRRLSENADFLASIAVSDRAIEEQYHMELALRFIVLRRLSDIELREISDIGDFLDTQMMRIVSFSPDEKRIEDHAFSETFRRINTELEESAFHKFDEFRSRFLGAFSISAYECFAIGLGYHYDVTTRLDRVTNLKSRVESMWKHNIFQGNSGSGVRASTRIPNIIPLGRQLFAP